MGLPLPLVDPLREIEQAEASHPVETLREATTASLKEAVSALSKSARDFEHGAARVKEASQAVRQEAEQKAATGAPSSDLDEHIESLQTWEERLRGEWLPQIEIAQEVKAGTFLLPRISAAEKAALVNVLERYIQALRGALEILRDLRWTLMALRAEVEGPGDAPVFDNPQDLLGYLKTPSS
jgi:prefoldin subunit 5